jgi:hypothetical protein
MTPAELAETYGASAATWVKLRRGSNPQNATVFAAIRKLRDAVNANKPATTKPEAPKTWTPEDTKPEAPKTWTPEDTKRLKTTIESYTIRQLTTLGNISNATIWQYQQWKYDLSTRSLMVQFRAKQFLNEVEAGIKANNIQPKEPTLTWKVRAATTPTPAKHPQDPVQTTVKLNQFMGYEGIMNKLATIEAKINALAEAWK